MPRKKTILEEKEEKLAYIELAKEKSKKFNYKDAVRKEAEKRYAQGVSSDKAVKEQLTDDFHHAQARKREAGVPSDMSNPQATNSKGYSAKYAFRSLKEKTKNLAGEHKQNILNIKEKWQEDRLRKNEALKAVEAEENEFKRQGRMQAVQELEKARIKKDFYTQQREKEKNERERLTLLGISETNIYTSPLMGGPGLGGALRIQEHLSHLGKTTNQPPSIQHQALDAFFSPNQPSLLGEQHQRLNNFLNNRQVQTQQNSPMSALNNFIGVKSQGLRKDSRCGSVCSYRAGKQDGKAGIACYPLRANNPATAFFFARKKTRRHRR